VANKDEMAEQIGTPEADKLSKADLQEQVATQQAAGLFVEADDTFKKHGKTVTGVQALVADDIPDAGL
jgi:hypothetical protein